jgi:hypothetical protein
MSRKKISIKKRIPKSEQKRLNEKLSSIKKWVMKNPMNRLINKDKKKKRPATVAYLASRSSKKFDKKNKQSRSKKNLQNS